MKTERRQIFLLILVLLFTYPQLPLYAQKLKQQTTTGNNTSKKNNKGSNSNNKNSKSGQKTTKKIYSTTITSYPSGATVYVNDVFAGYTPYVYHSENPGYIKIQCSKIGFSPQTRNLYVNRDQQVNFELEYEYKALSITSNPSGASIWINGKFVGTTPYTYNAKKGEYISITCTHEGYQNAYKTLTTDLNQNVNFTLTSERSSQTSNYNNYSSTTNYYRYNTVVDKSYPKNNFYIDAGVGSFFNNESWYSIASSIGFNVRNFNMQWDLNYGLDNTAIFTDIMLGFNKRLGKSKFAFQGGLGCYASDYEESHSSVGFALGIRYDFRLCKHLTFYANPVVVLGNFSTCKLSTGISFYL